VGERFYDGDLIFRDGKPVLVVSWRTVDRARVPYIAFPLDPAFLKPSSKEGHFVYRAPLLSRKRRGSFTSSPGASSGR
jgi:hypothetical protein